MGNSALLIVDIQNDYFQGGKMPLENMEKAGENAGKLLDYFRKKKLPVIHIQHISIRPEAGFFLPGTPGVEINSCVAPAANELVITKNFPNSFRETPLLEHLQALRIEDLVICGAMSLMCIDATTRAAFDLGFKCTVAHDACAARALTFGGQTVSAADVNASYMAALGMVYAKVVSYKEIV